MIVHHLVTAVLVYVLIGALTWLVISGTGAVDRVALRDKRPSSLTMFFAICLVMLRWPEVVLTVVMALAGRVRR
jgi:hypothetical protein